MILFQDDWKKYPGAIIDTKTRNRSFYNLALLYKKMGVKNHAFPLALINPELQGIDPFNPNLTEDQQAAIGVECKLNPWYFFREVARVPGRAGGDAEFLRANRGNISLYWLFFNHVTTILIQIRQTGKSLSMDELASYLMNIACTKTQINLLTKDEKLREENIARLKSIMDELPWYLAQRTQKDANNTEEVTVLKNENKFKTHLPNKSPKIALNVGRGLTSPIFFIDEFAFLFNIGISLPAALAGGTAARDIARNNGSPYGTIMSTTAGKKDDRDGRYAYKIVSSSAPWNEAYLDAENIEELESIIRSASPERHFRVNCTFNHRQLGYTDEWLKRAVEESIGEGLDVARDFYNVWSSGSQTSPLSNQLTATIRSSERDPDHTSISRRYNYVLRWFVPEHLIDKLMTSESHIISLDSSEAIGKDDIGLTIRNARTGEIVAAANINETNLIMFSEWLCELFIKYEKMIGIIERRSTGSTILDYLILKLVAANIDPFRRLYNKVVQDKDEFPERFKEIDKPLFSRPPDVIVKYRKYFGFSTSGSGATARNALYSTTLLNAAKMTGASVHDAIVIRQILGLTSRNGRIDHEDGEHDDMVISWLLSFWLLSLGKHLSYYGLDTRQLLQTTIDATRRDTSQKDVMKKRSEQQAFKNAFDVLVEQLRNEKDIIVIPRLEASIRQIAARLEASEEEIISVDKLLSDIAEKKRSAHLNRQFGLPYNQAVNTTTYMNYGGYRY